MITIKKKLNNEIKNIRKEKNTRKWLAYKNFSCRYDTFTFIYTFSIKNLLKFKENNIVITKL